MHQHLHGLPEYDTRFEGIMGLEIARLFLVVYPPFGEPDWAQLDISFGFVFRINPERLIVIATDERDHWSPCIFPEPLPGKIFDWNEYKPRMLSWMESKMQDQFGFEYFEITSDPLFANISGQTIKKVEYVKLKGREPFGVKISFDNDFILSTAIADGNTVETREFNHQGNLAHFERLGIIYYEPVI
ncbi:hypothetical protein COR50_12685 [Chitinophaga caeni]|uniref:Uncharacterized protein n=1 Tax=Chitinophaga caeni TaxID=2029983 RepID=A0A291QVJ3_9BACT|nr:hypothetical protein [Chitinophaga caeni]ATL47955.1 hypothetical protein COR50_12685 [Chitinophaga caeni]